MRRIPRVLVLLAVAVVLPGCGGGGVPVTGKILKNGQPLTVGDKGMIQVTLIPQGGAGEGNTYTADVKPDGTFQVKGKEGAGIPAGSYKVAVQAFDPYPTNDLLKGQFAPGKTTITRDIKGKTDLTIDVAKPEG